MAGVDMNAPKNFNRIKTDRAPNTSQRLCRVDRQTNAAKACLVLNTVKMN